MSFRRLFSLVVLVLLIIFCAKCVSYLYIAYEHHHWYWEVHAILAKMSSSPPPEVNKTDWEYAIGVTMSLHGNCGGPLEYITDRERQMDFLSELKQKVAQGIDEKLIEWIWSQYGLFTQFGIEYKLKYYPIHYD